MGFAVSALCRWHPQQGRLDMSEESDRLRKRFNDLAKQAQEFFEEVGVEPGTARHIADHA